MPSKLGCIYRGYFKTKEEAAAKFEELKARPINKGCHLKEGIVKEGKGVQLLVWELEHIERPKRGRK